VDLSFINDLFNKIASNNQHAHNIQIPIGQGSLAPPPGVLRCGWDLLYLRFLDWACGETTREPQATARALSMLQGRSSAYAALRAVRAP
jgi:hypothetical protein